MGKGQKMDGWETTFLSFWDTAYFQGRTCCEFPGRGKLSTDTIISTNLKHKGEIRWLILVQSGITPLKINMSKGTISKGK